MKRALSLVIAALCLAGCSAQVEDESASNDEAELRSRAIKTEFGCRIAEDWDYDLGVELSSKGTKLHVEWGLDNIVEGDGAIDPTYRPRAGNANFVRFVGFKGLADAFGEPIEETTILVEKPLLEGKPGRVKLQFVHADGEFDQRVNSCI